MAKRFITTELFDDPWFLDLPAKYKIFWIYLVTKCDHSGIWQVNFKTAAFNVGEHLEPIECERILRDRIIKISDGKYWFIPKFITFQYGEILKESNPAICNVIKRLQQLDLFQYLKDVEIIKGASKELQRSFKAPKEEEKEKEEKEEEVLSSLESINLKLKEKNKEKSPAKIAGDFIDSLLDLFCLEYKNNRNLDFIIQRGKDRKAIGIILNEFKKKSPEKKSAEVFEDFRQFFLGCLNVSDKWLFDNVSPTLMSSKLNSYISFINKRNFQIVKPNENKSDYQKRLSLTKQDLMRSAAEANNDDDKFDYLFR